MIIHHSNRAYFEKPLHDVLDKFYTAEELWEIFLGQMSPLLNKTPPEKRPVKGILVRQMKELLNSKEIGQSLFESMDPTLRSILELLVWEGNFLLSNLEKKVGCKLMTTTSPGLLHGYRNVNKTYQPKPGLYWVAFDVNWSYFGEATIIVCLPPAIRSLFKKQMPKPVGYNVEPIETLPPNLKTFRCDDLLAEEFRVVTDYITRGHLQFTANETIKRSCVRTVAGLTSGGEFFPDEKSSAKLPLLRHEILINLISSCGKTLREAMLDDPPDPAKMLLPLCEALFDHPEWLSEIVLPYLKEKGFNELSEEASRNLYSLFAMLPEGKWVQGCNLETIVSYREINVDLFYGRRVVTIDRSSPSYNYSRCIEINETNIWTLQIAPLLKGTAFLLAAIGLAEIAYTLPPKHAMWRRPSECFLTPFDGLFAIRLTPAGAYAFGHRTDLELKSSNRKRAEIILNPRRLTATCRNIDPITEMSLLEYMEKVSDGCYRMTRHSLMRGCATQNDVEKRVTAFRQHIAEDLPPFWNDFFESAIQTAVALHSLSGYTIYDLADSPELRKLFMSDPVLRKKTLRVEGLRVAIKNTDEPGLRRHLIALGYLM